MPCLSSLKIISRSTITPQNKSSQPPLKLSVSDLPMLSCQYIQKGVLLTKPPIPTHSLVTLIKLSLSQTLTHFPPLAGRLKTDSHGFVHIVCNDAGVEFRFANAGHLTIDDILSPSGVPDWVKELFAFDNTISYDGHYKPLLAVQLTELGDGVFIGCTVNHAVTDGTSFWNFFNCFAEICRDKNSNLTSKQPDFTRNFFVGSQAVLSFPNGTGPKVTFDVNAPLKERIFGFTRESIFKLKSRANCCCWFPEAEVEQVLRKNNQESDRTTTQSQISSFQALSAQLWRSVTRARNLPPTKTTTFRMAVNCRHRLEPRIHPLYFGNAIQSIPTLAPSGHLLSRDLHWCAHLLHANVVAHNDAKVRQGVHDFETNPRVFPLGNFDGASITMGSSPRFPMYDNDFGWGHPIAVRSGRANKFDGKISAFPGKQGAGSVDLEVCLAPATMAALQSDMEFMQYVSAI